MTDPARAGMRAARAVLFALLTLALAAAAHSGAGAAPPHPLLAAVVLPLLALPFGWLAAQRLRLPTILAAMGVCQLALHQLFCWLPAGTGASATVLIDCHDLLVDPVRVATLTAGSTMAPAHHGTSTMLLAHAAATALLALLLAHGERLLFTIWHVCRFSPPTRVMPRLTGTYLPHPSALAAPARTRPAHAVPYRRGPPALA